MVVARFTRRRIEPAVIGGVGLWLIVGVGSAIAGALFSSPAASAEWLGRPAAWYFVTLLASLIVGAMLTLAQERLRDQRLRGAVTTGALLGLLGAVGVLAAGVNAGTFTLAVPRAAILVLGVICASMLVFARRANSHEGYPPGASSRGTTGHSGPP